MRTTYEKFRSDPLLYASMRSDGSFQKSHRVPREVAFYPFMFQFKYSALRKHRGLRSTWNQEDRERKRHDERLITAITGSYQAVISPYDGDEIYEKAGR